MPDSVSDLPRFFGGTAGSGLLRSCAEDFYVEEIPAAEPSGEGEHCLIEIEKRDTNTDWVAKQLARLAGVPAMDVSYAGLKDRHAVTRQWFSVRLAAKPEPDWHELDCDEIRVLETERHNRKLKRGALRGNRFRIRIRDFHGDPELLRARLESMASQGVPNYFGAQRFGRNGANLEKAQALFDGRLRKLSRSKKGIYLSAARSLLFNRVVAERISCGYWDRPLEGDWMSLDGSRSGFLTEVVDDELMQRFRDWDVHPTGPMWGRGREVVAGQVADLEAQVLKDLGAYREGLERAGLQMERRSLRARVETLEWELQDTLLELRFTLPKGSYATVMLRECVDFTEAERALAGESG